jgi:hypothetical protein
VAAENMISYSRFEPIILRTSDGAFRQRYNHTLEQAADDWNDMHETESDSKNNVREPFKQN